jgi:plasmid maintenance system antidote protein VapI
MLTKRKPASVGEILNRRIHGADGPNSSALADAMGAQRKHVNELCNDRRNVTAPTAVMGGDALAP